MQPPVLSALPATQTSSEAQIRRYPIREDECGSLSLALLLLVLDSTFFVKFNVEFKIMAYYVDQRDWTQSSRVAETTVIIDVLPQDVSEMQ